ncbi:MAG: hypothetical protein A3J93_01270 [Candidatus Magasanikbacteria bacterium RIFOXYC2_FULL_42_28]|uniref:Uncharacterized protein n=1 Tax=Candidatus Magasanikbacteria bacterium RIFOXYC2_FULL_42_28 TaxID=1798704 RepID=A0A1F6NXQ8_9BACT|nr:MAG: hypothetical protein A3J93_01270 [Candidatus Magasanikbacteria bacterium RIFOXYC2_FULL_42_28]
MNNVLKLTKKAFTVSVVVTTIMWSLGVAALVPSVAQAADCPALAAGQMIKAGGPGIWVVGTNLTSRTYFPHGDVYKSWTADNAYTFTTVSDACLADLDPAGAVLPRSGTFIVREVSAPSINYVVLPGKKLQQISDGAAKALYGADYATLLSSKNGYNQYKRLVVVSDADWGYYNTGSNKVAGELTEATPTEGMLVSNGGKTYYVDAGMKLREVTDTGFAANKFQTKNVLALSSTAAYSMGTALNAQEDMFTDHGVAVESAPVVPPVVVNGNLEVSISANTPAGGNVVINIDNVVFGKFILKATNGDYTVSSVKIGRKGLGAKGDIASVTLYDGATKLGSSMTSWDSNSETLVYNIPTGLKVTNGTNKELTVVAKLDTAGTYNSLGILAVNGTAVSAVYGNEMTGVDVAVGALSITNMGTAATKKIGVNAVNLAEFKLNVSSTEDGVFNSITLKNKAATSNASDTDVANLYLYQGATKLAGPVSMASDKVAFVLNTPVTIKKSQNEVFKVVGDIVKGNANTLEFVLENTTDLVVMGSTYGTNLVIHNDQYNAAAEGAIITISGAELNVAYTGTTLETIDDVTDVVFGTLSLGAGSTDIKITSLILTVDETEGNATAADTLDVDSFELVDAAGGAYSGTMTAGGDTDADDETWTFSDEIYLTAGTTRTFTMRGDLPNGIGNGDSYKVSATVNTTNVVAETVPEGDTVSNFSIGSFTGMLVTVKTPTLRVEGATLNSGTATVNDADVILYKGTLEAQASNIKVSYVNFNSNVAFASGHWTQVGFYLVNADGSYAAQQILTNSQMTSSTSASGDALSFDSLDFTVNNGPTNKATFVVKGTVASTLTDTNGLINQLKLDYITSKAADNSSPTVSSGSAAGTDDLDDADNDFLTVGGRQVTLVDKGKLYLQMRSTDTGFNKDSVVLAGTSFWAGKLKLKADDENIKVKDLKLTNATDSGEERSAASVCLYREQVVLAANLISCQTMDASSVVFYDDINEVVEQGTEYWYIYVNTNPMNDLAGGTARTHDVFSFKVTTSTASSVAAEGVRSGFTYVISDDATVSAGDIVFDEDNDDTYDEAGELDMTTSTKKFVVSGTKISNVQLLSSYGCDAAGNNCTYKVDPVLAGTGEYVAGILAVTVDSVGLNNDPDNGNPLKLNLTGVRFDVDKFASTSLSGVTIQKIGGSDPAGSLDISNLNSTGASAGLASTTALSGVLANDYLIDPGTIAYYVVKATVNGVSATTNFTNWFQFNLDDIKGTYTDGDTSTEDDVNNNIDWKDGDSSNPFSALFLSLENVDGVKVSKTNN